MKDTINYFVTIFLLGCGAVVYLESMASDIRKESDEKYCSKELINEKFSNLGKRFDKFEEKLDQIKRK